MKGIVSAIVGLAVVFLLLFWQVSSRDMHSAGRASLAWHAGSEPDIAGYRVYYGAEKRTSDCPDGGYASKADAGKRTAYHVGGLDDGVTYYFSVTSYDKQGNESCFSPEMSKVIKVSFVDKLWSLAFGNK